MSDPTRYPPVPTGQPGEAEPGDRKRRWEEIIEKLQQERDELRLRVHLGKAEAREELAKLDVRLDELRTKGRAARGEAGEALDDIENAAKKLWGEIREGYDRVRRSLSS
jgi:hypothetical protein